MAFASLDTDDDAPLAEINMIPLIDVMLVLLVIFIVAAPLLQHAVPIDLPQANATPLQTQPETVRLSIDDEARLYWNDTPITTTQLAQHMSEAAQHTPQPELHLAAARRTPYEKVAEVMAAAARAGLTRIGFVTDPSQR